MTFQGQPHDGGIAFLQAFEDAKKSSCEQGYFKVQSEPGIDSFTLSNGIAFGPVLRGEYTAWSVDGAGKMPFPIDQILAGQPFMIDSGPQTSSDGKTNMTIRVEFTAPG